MQVKYSILGYLGLLFLIIGLLAWAIVTELTTLAVVFMSLGGVVLLAYISINISYLVQKITGKTAVAGANMFISIVIFGAIVVFLEMILTRHSQKIDMTEAKKFSLASQTIQLLEGLEEPINMLYLENPSDPGATQNVKDMMELYQHHSSEVTYEIIDPERQPEKVEELAPVTLGAIYLQKGDVHEKVSPVDENNLTNAFLKIAKGGNRVVYFTTGHDESGLESQENNGLFAMNQVLSEEGYEPKDLQLYTEGSVPDDAVAVVIAGPQKPFFEPELDALKTYLDAGGKLFVMIDPEKNTGVEKLLEEHYGIVFGNNWVVENNPFMRMFGGSPNAPVISEVEEHPITSAFSNGVPAIMFPIVQSVRLKEELPEGVEGTEILKTSSESWIETDLEEIRRTSSVELNTGIDERGPVPIAVTVSKPIEDGGAVEETDDSLEEEDSTEDNVEELDVTNEMRIVAFGDSNFAQNANYRNSMDLFSNCVNWLARQEDMISIRPKDDSGQPIMVSQFDANKLFYTSMIITPGAVAIFGAFVCIRRRYRG